MNPNTVIRHIAYIVLLVAVAGIAVGIARSSPAFALAQFALASSQVTIISLTKQIERKEAE